MRLYDYYRSSAAYRTRIALNLKGLHVESTTVDLRVDEQFAPAYRGVNPQARVPSLVLADGTVMTQSPAILEWLEETYPEPPLLPQGPLARQRVRAAVALIACDIHPLNNLAVLRYLKRELAQPQEAIDTWYRHWVTAGFDALEVMIEAAPFCFGDRPTLADIALVPQAANARRLHMAVEAWPRIAAADAACRALRPFADAAPEAVVPAG